jgi:HSP20 family molecular chaperone IbpA
MKNKMIFNAAGFTYPGEYVPLFTESEVQQVLNLSQECKTLEHPVNITERPDAYRFEVAMPGIERENILLLANGNTISIIVIKNTCSVSESEDFNRQESDSDCFSCYLNVADNADLEFANAVCHSGMLRIYVPKSTTKPVNKGPINIIVY